MATIRKKHVLVLGCGRSGTSIFGELFQDTGRFDYHSEISMDQILDLDTTRPIALKVPRPSEFHASDSGLSFSFSTLIEKLEHNLEVFWIIRHPLDTICSLRVGIAKGWGHHPRPPDWQDWLDEPLFNKCAHHWNYINSVSFSRVKDLANVVFFEDMIRDPRLFANGVLKNIGSENPKINSWCARVRDKTDQYFIEAVTSRPYSRDDHSTRIGRWKENMSVKEAEEVWSMVRGVAENFGYQK